MKKNIAAVGLILLILLNLMACKAAPGGSEQSSADGESLFHQSVLGNAAGCATCHSTEDGTIIVGPSLAGVGMTAGQRVDGLSAEQYLRQSITEPDAYVVQGFPKGVMPSKYGVDLTQEEIDNLVAYLLTLQ